MGRHPLTFTAEKAIPAAQAAPSLATVLPFKRRARLLTKFEPVTSTSEGRLPKTPRLARTEGSGWSAPMGVVIDFARANQDGRAAQKHEYLSNETRHGLTAMDCAVIAYVVLSAAFYPALVWLLTSWGHVS